MNEIKAALLLSASTAALIWGGNELAGAQGTMVAFAVATALNIRAYWFGPEIAINRHEAKPAEPAWPPDRQLIEVVNELSIKAGIPAPLIYVYESGQANAFTAGPHPERAIIFASTGLLSLLSRDELSGVIAHELAHIKAHDTLVMSVAVTLASVVGAFAALLTLTGMALHKRGGMAIIVSAILGVLAAIVLTATLSRSREYGADRKAAELCGNKQWLIEALRKLGEGKPVRNDAADRHPHYAPAYFVNPLSIPLLRGLFSTHPTTKKRIARLEAL